MNIKESLSSSSKLTGIILLTFIPSSAMSFGWGPRDANPDQAWWAYELCREMNLAGLPLYPFDLVKVSIRTVDSTQAVV